METLAEAANKDKNALNALIAKLPELYDVWIDVERRKLTPLPSRRKEAGERLVLEMEQARDRIVAGIDLLLTDPTARSAFGFMNLAVASAARRRNAGPKVRTVVADTLGRDMQTALGWSFDLARATSSARVYDVSTIPVIKPPLPAGVSGVRFLVDLSDCRQLGRARIDALASHERALLPTTPNWPSARGSRRPT